MWIPWRPYWYGEEKWVGTDYEWKRGTYFTLNRILYNIWGKKLGKTQ